LLSQTRFADGLVGGVPTGIPVAHKFGERTFQQGGVVQHKELHDCGLVYHPKGPFGLCVMTRGIDFADLAQTIRKITRMVYDEVSNGIN
jgi:beta-lactamase class A